MAAGKLARALAALVAGATVASCAAPMRLTHVPAPDARGFLQAVASLSSSLIARGKTTGFWYRPDRIFAERIAAVKRARETVHFETYYMTPGRRADDFAAALLERAEHGVKITFLADADGCKYLPPSYWKRLRQAGVEVRFYHPWDWGQPWVYNTRTHRKLLLIDGQVAFTGGAGVSDDWDGDQHQGPWAEAEVRLEGPVVSTLEGIYAQHWTYVGGAADVGSVGPRPYKGASTAMLVTPSGPTGGVSPMRALYHTLLLSARKRIWIASPYFLPTLADQAALIAAHRRGVDVKILSVGPKNDQPGTYFAVEEAAVPMVAAGVDIQEYQPAMMHAKVMLIDDRWVVNGSANMDPRSFFHNEELNVASDEPELAKEARAFFDDGFKHAKPLDEAGLKCRDLWACAQSKALLVIWWYL